MINNQFLIDKARKAKNLPNTAPILSATDFCKGSFIDKKGGKTCCMLGWFREIFCHEKEATDDANRENYEKDEHGEEFGINLRRKYTSWKAQSLQAIMKECKRVEKDSKDEMWLLAFPPNTKCYLDDNILKFNDDPLRRLETLARVWNRAMARLGYVVGNPEA